MAFQSGLDEIDESQDTFSDWLAKTNTVLRALRGGVAPGDNSILTANNEGATTIGDAVLIGQFTGNTVAIYDELRGGDYLVSGQLNVTSNTFYTAACDLVRIYHDLFIQEDTTIDRTLHVIGNTVIGGWTHTETESPSIKYDSYLIVNGTDSDVRVQGGNVTFQWYGGDASAPVGYDPTDSSYHPLIADNAQTSNSEIRTTANGDLIIHADVTDQTGTTESTLQLKVDGQNRIIIRGDGGTSAEGNVDIYATSGEVEMRWDALPQRLGIVGSAADDPKSTLDVDGLTRVDQLIVDGSVSSNVYIGNTSNDYTAFGSNENTTSSHWLNINKGTDAVSGITIGGSIANRSAVMKVDALESLVLSVNTAVDAVNGGRIQLVTDTNNIRQEIQANGNIIINDATANPDFIWDAADSQLGINKPSAELILSTVDIDGITRVDELIVDGNATSNVTIGNTTTFSAVGESHWLHIRKGADAVSGITFSNTSTAQVTLSVDATESVYLNVEASVNGDANGHVYIQTSSGETRQVVYANGDISFTDESAVDKMIWDGGRSVADTTATINNGFLRHLDSVASSYGDGDDLVIYHSATNSYITDRGTGSLFIRGTDIVVEKEDGTKTSITANTDGEVVLYHNNVAVLETTGAEAGEVQGVEVFGEANTATLRVRGDANWDGAGGLDTNNMYWDASANTLALDMISTFQHGNTATASLLSISQSSVTSDHSIQKIGTGNTYISSSNLILEDESGYGYIEMVSGGAVNLYYDSQNNTTRKLATTATGIDVLGTTVTDNLTVENNAVFHGTGLNSVNWTASTHTWNFNDISKLTFGTGGDFAIYYDQNGAGPDRIMIEETTGLPVFFQANTFTLENTAGEDFIHADEGTGAVSLYWTGTAPGAKLATKSDGVTVTGIVYSDGLDMGSNDRINLGDANTFYMYTTGTDSFITEMGTGNLSVQANNLILQSTTGENYLQGVADGSTTVYYNGLARVTTTNDGVNLEGQANTDTLRVQSTSEFEGNINIQGSTGADTLTWTKADNTLNFDDNNFATFGTGGDLILYHSGTNSYVRNTAGELYIEGDGISLRSITSSENYITADVNGAVTLYHDNTVRLTTTGGAGAGVTVSGIVTADGLDMGNGDEIALGDADTFKIWTDGTTSNIQETGTGNLNITANNFVIRTTASEAYIDGVADGQVNLYHNGIQRLRTTATGVFVNNQIQANTLSLTSTASIAGNVSITGTSTLAVGGNVNFDSDVIIGTDQNDTLTVNAQGDFNANVVFNNVRVDGIANIAAIEIQSVVLDNHTIASAQTTISSTSNVLLDETDTIETIGSFTYENQLIKYTISAFDNATPKKVYSLEANILVSTNGTLAPTIHVAKYAELPNQGASTLLDVTPAFTVNGTGATATVRFNAACPTATTNPVTYVITKTVNRTKA